MEEPDPLDQLRRRFALRLDATLDKMGYPSERTDRCRELGSGLGVDPALANTFLSGRSLPDYPQLVAVCVLTGKQIGYFLDEAVPTLAQQATVVKSLGPGEDLIVMLPKEMMPAGYAGRGLVYHRAKVGTHGFGIEAGDYLIAQGLGASCPPEPHRLYLFSESEGFAVRRCSEVSGPRAVFLEWMRPTIPHIVPLAQHANATEAMSFGQLVASLRGGRELHLHA